MTDSERVVWQERHGTPVTLNQWAEVTSGGERRQGSASVDGREAVIGTAMMLSGANSRAVAVAAREQFEAVKQSLPPDVIARTVLDRSRLVHATIDTVAHNLFYGALLVVVVLFALLGNRAFEMAMRKVKDGDTVDWEKMNLQGWRKSLVYNSFYALEMVKKGIWDSW